MEKLHVKDKGTANHSYYVTEGWGLVIHSFTYQNKGYIQHWELVGPTDKFNGSTQQELIDTLKQLKDKFQLQKFNDRSKEILVIYTDNIMKVQGFTQPITTDDSFSFYFQVLDNIEFRGCWREDLEEADKIQEWAQVIINTVFIPDKRFYLTGPQLTRIRTQNIACLRSWYEIIAPRTFPEYEWYRKAVFGGCYFCPYPGVEWNDRMLGFDLISAYIYCICCKKHCMSKEQQIYFPKEWTNYLDNDDYGSVGQYNIKYKCKSNLINTFKDVEGNHLTKSEYDDWKEVTVRFCNVDLRLFIGTVEEYKIECTELYIFKMDYLPKEYIELVIRDFIKKNNDKTGNPYEYKNDKIILNSHHGNMIRNITTNERWKAEDRKEVLPIQWGLFVTAYCRELLFLCGKCLDGWRYSAVDSIKCKDTEQNKYIISEFNKAIQEETKAMCDHYGIDFEPIKTIGNFDLEDHITRFKEWAPNQYAFISEEKGMIVKASGCNKKQMEINEKLFSCKKLPGGTKITGDINDEKTSIDIEDRHYESDGYYFEAKDNIDDPIEQFRYVLRWILR